MKLGKLLQTQHKAFVCFVFVFFNCIFTYLSEGLVHTTAGMSPEDSFQELVLPFHHVRPRDRTPVLRLGSRHLSSTESPCRTLVSLFTINLSLGWPQSHDAPASVFPVLGV